MIASLRRMLGVTALLLWLVTACAPVDLLEPPRLATQTAQTAQLVATPTERLLPAPTPTPRPPTPQPTVPAPTFNTTITVWIDETSDAHIAAARDIAAGFAATNDIQVELRFIKKANLPGLVRTAALTDRLPDLILHGMEYTTGWVEDGILDPAAASAVVDALGAEQFMPGVLDVILDADGMVPALPSSGWQQLLIFRQDWLDSAELPTPTSFDRLLETAATFYNLETDIITGIVVPTDDELVGTQRAFEHFAIANGCQIVAADGTISALHPRCLEALDFYRAIVNQYSPPGYQTDLSAMRAYLAGRTAMILTSPEILPELAGFNDDALPRCPECSADARYLADNTGVVTTLVGTPQWGRPANFSQLTYLGITTVADRDSAEKFARYWLTDGYLTWLAVNPERKAPLYWGTDGQYRAAWFTLPMSGGTETIADVYGEPLAQRLLDGLAVSPRWGFAEAPTPVISLLYEDLSLSSILQEMLSGYITSAQAIVEINDTLTTLSNRR